MATVSDSVNKPHDHCGRRAGDPHIRTAHHMAGHDAFVTSDYDDIAKKREHLWERASIRVYTPDEAMRAIDVT